MLLFIDLQVCTLDRAQSGMYEIDILLAQVRSMLGISVHRFEEMSLAVRNALVLSEIGDFRNFFVVVDFRCFFRVLPLIPASG